MLQKYISSLTNWLSDKNARIHRNTQQHRKPLVLHRDLASINHQLKELIYALEIEKAEGAYIYDTDGNKYLDICMGFGVHLFGHNPSLVNNALKDQLEAGFFLGPPSPLEAEVVRKICQLTGNERVAFFNSGTEAVIAALKLAKAATQKTHVAFFRGVYHGTFDPLLSIKNDRQTLLAQKVTQNPGHESIVLEYGDPAALQFIEKHADQLAAVLVEPVQGHHPDLQPVEFLRRLRFITQQRNITLIFDEVITGFRAAVGGAQEYFGIKADMVTYGKIVGGGLPVGVVGGKGHFLDAADGGYGSSGSDSSPELRTNLMTGNFYHHPLTLRAMDAVLSLFERDQGEIQATLNEQTARFCNEMNEYFEENGLPISLEHFSSLFRFQMRGKARLLYYQLFYEGIYLWEGCNCFFSTAHTDVEMELLKAAIKRSCETLVEYEVIKR